MGPVFESDPFTQAYWAFITGADAPPPVGFPQEPAIFFVQDPTKTLPTASTCSLSLYLPLSLTDYEVFQQ